MASGRIVPGGLKRVITLVLAFVLVCLSIGCGAAADPTPGPGRQWDRCGINEPVCGQGLECFGTCSFECGEKYFAQPDGSYEYGLDQPTVDRCSALGGACVGFPGGVPINVCTLPATP